MFSDGIDLTSARRGWSRAGRRRRDTTDPDPVDDPASSGSDEHWSPESREAAVRKSHNTATFFLFGIKKKSIKVLSK